MRAQIEREGECGALAGEHVIYELRENEVLDSRLTAVTWPAIALAERWRLTARFGVPTSAFMDDLG